MAEYRSYSLNRAGSIVGVGWDFTCVDDAAAIEMVYAMHPEHRFEVWQGARRVYVREAPIDC